MIVPVSLQREHTSPAVDDRYAGIRALWIKVIIRAVFDWVAYRDSDRLFQKKLADSAHSWLFKQNELFNGFENICHMLDINPNRVRTWAKTMSKDQVAKIEHLERYPSSSLTTGALELLAERFVEEEELTSF